MKITIKAGILFLTVAALAAVSARSYAQDPAPGSLIQQERPALHRARRRHQGQGRPGQHSKKPWARRKTPSPFTGACPGSRTGSATTPPATTPRSCDLPARHRVRQEGHRAQPRQGRGPASALGSTTAFTAKPRASSEPVPGQAHQGGDAPRSRDRPRLRPRRRRPYPRPVFG